MRHLILVGACYLDTILTVPVFPDEDAKQRATALQVRRGGNCSNAAEVLQQLVVSTPLDQAYEGRQQGLMTHLVSVLPSNSAPATQKILSSFVTNELGQAGGENDIVSGSLIDFGQCLYRQRHSEPASSYIIRSEATGSRTIVNYNDLPEMTVDEFKVITAALLAGTVSSDNPNEPGDTWWWHFEGRIPSTTLRCIRHLRQTMPGGRCTISVEVEKPGRDGLRELAAEADIVFYSRSWAESRGYANAEACLRGEASLTKASLMLCTWGAQGADCLSRPRGEHMHCPANPTGKEMVVVDTIGAGDTFIAGMLYGLLVHVGYGDEANMKGNLDSHADNGDVTTGGEVASGENGWWDLKTVLAFAVDLATRKVQREGFAGLV